MPELIWKIGDPLRVSPDLADNYGNPNLLGDSVTWRVGETGQQWPMFHASEADPEGGYRPHPHRIVFELDDPAPFYRLRVQYTVIAARLPYLELRLNGTPGRVYLNPKPDTSGDIRTLMGLHAAIYSSETVHAVIPSALLKQGENVLEIVAVDGGEFLRVENPEQIKRLDRAATGAGILYECLELTRLEDARVGAGGHTPLLHPTALYRRSDGGLVEECGLHLELFHPIEAQQWRLELEGLGTLRLEVPAAAFGHVRVPFDLPDGEGPVRYVLRGPLGVWEGELRRTRKWKVHITPHAHTDIGYTHRQWEVAERLCRNLDFALDTLEREGAEGLEPAFSYHLDAAWVLEVWWKTRGPERHRQLRRWAGAGKVSCSGTYADLLTQFAGLEDHLQNSILADDLLKPAGLHSDFATVVDVASLTASYPDLLQGCGIRYLVHANNQDRGPFRLLGGLHRVSPFWWGGQAGGRVLVWLSKMYCELRKVCGSPPGLASAGRGLELWLQEYDRDDYAPDAVLLYGQEADNTDLDPQPLEFVRRWNRTYAYPQLIPSSISDFFRYVEGNFGDRLPQYRGDGGAYWEDGVGSSLLETLAVRQAQADLPAAEGLEALAVLHNPGWAYPSETFQAAWREVLLYDEHTWGAFLSGREPEAWLAQDQWATKRHFARQAEELSKRLLHVAAVRHSLNWNTEGREVVVYNPHNWPVSGLCRVEIEPGEAAVDADTGEEIPMRRVRMLPSQMMVELWVENLPGLSYRRFPLKRGIGTQGLASLRVGNVKEVSGSITLENPHYRLTLEPQRGCAVSWFDKQLGRELLDLEDVFGLGQFIYARGGEGTRLMGNPSQLPPGNLELLSGFALIETRSERHAWGQTVTLRGRVEGGILTAEWTLPDLQKRVDLRYTYEKEERTAKEAVYVALPLNLPGAAVSSDSHLGWVNWDQDELPGGCKEWLPLQSGILLETAGAAVFAASPDVPLFTVGDVVRGRWPKTLELRGGRIFSYVLGNYWHTNYRASQGGKLGFRYRLTSGPRIRKAEASRWGLEARRGLYAHRISFQDFRQPKAPYSAPTGGTLARLEGPITLSTLRAERGGAGFVLRLREIEGREGLARFEVPGRPIARAWTTDLLERDRHPLLPEPDGSLSIPVPPWGLATVGFELEDA